jgi:phosphopantetheine--protein transferase-like protein
MTPELSAGVHVAGLGIDAVDVTRFRRVITRRPRLVERVFTEAERAYALRRADPAQRLAARFAAKEAVMKALGVGIGGFNMRDVEVVRATGPGPRSRRGAPSIRLFDGAARVAAERGVERWHVALTHTDELALAVVVAESGGPGPG